MKIRKFLKAIALFLAFDLLLNLLLPTVSHALTSGPSQPEVQGFSPAGMDKMVDPFTGDFNYNIPLLEVGNYPVNISYSSGVTPDQEASWVGLGWNLSVGSISRSVRGLPDDFKGEEVEKDFNIKPNQTYGLNVNTNYQLFGAQILKGSIGYTQNYFINNYNGFGFSVGLNPSLSAGVGQKTSLTGSMGLNATLGSESGIEVTPTVGISAKMEKQSAETSLNASISFPYSTREGLKGRSFSGGFSAGNGIASIDRSGEVFNGYAWPTYTPELEHNRFNVNASVNFSVYYTDPPNEYTGGGVGGYYSGQFLTSKTRSTPAYGYMYSGASDADDKLMDFNREKDRGGFNNFTTNLPVTNYTHDVFQVSGGGVSGSYRLHRGDVGTVHDPLTMEHGYKPSLGAEYGLGGPPSGLAGIDLEYNFTESYSGKWDFQRSFIPDFNDEHATSLNNPGNEVVYFKKMGEAAPERDAEFLNNIQHRSGLMRHGVADAAHPHLNGKYKVKDHDHSTFSSGDKEVNVDADDNHRTKRRPRTGALTTLTAEQASDGGAFMPIYSYDRSFNWNEHARTLFNPSFDAENQGYAKTQIDRIGGGRKSHHISEARVTNEKGQRYIYGIPAYNKKKEEVTLASPGSDVNRITGRKEYTSQQASKENESGRDHYYSKTSTPAYAHSYLLTAKLSSDYVDSDNIKGPSQGDRGTYTKFNYTRVHENYRWRTPYSEDQMVANFRDAMRGDHQDDKASYVYGEKEIWYLHSIETRTHIAEFHLKDRKDALGAAGEHGGKGTQKKKYLDKIVLYSRADKHNSEAEPIKTVHFDYDYSLCPGTNNSNAPNQGKLTLRKIWYTYGESKKGVKNPYVFNYGKQDFNPNDDLSGKLAPENDLNPAYSLNNYDRWNNYKKDREDSLRNNVAPYSIQQERRSNRNAAVYALSSIQTPTGGTMMVFYESDDYGYVQDRRAMRMFKIEGFRHDPGSSTTNNLYVQQGVSSAQYNDYVVVDLGQGFKPDGELDPDEQFRQAYLEGIDLMYFKVLAEVLGEGAALSANRSEYVPGYAEIDKSASQLLSQNQNGRYTKALVKLKRVNAKGSDKGGPVNPICRTGWMFARMNLNRELSGLGDINNNALEQVFGAIYSAVQEVGGIFADFEREMTVSRHMQTVSTSKDAGSFVRLREPDYEKEGGGHRVKALVMSDNWSRMESLKEMNNGNMPDKETAYYGQFYDYTMEQDGDTISSGVAAYEPALGKEENPFHQPTFVEEEAPLAPNQRYFMNKPFGESFFPSPGVGYRQVTVTPLKMTEQNLADKEFRGNGTGRVEHEFYTSYEFPTKTNQTDIKTKRKKPELLYQFLTNDSRDLALATQGYYVETNDMHGKRRSKVVYPEEGVDENGDPTDPKPITEKHYYYKRNEDGTLNNQVPYIDSGLQITEEGEGTRHGVTVDVVHDERHHQTSTFGAGTQINLKYAQIGPIPVIASTLFANVNSSVTDFKSMVTTKVVRRSGILEKVVTKDKGAVIEKRNKLWDKQTGDVVLKEVDNEFHDQIYNFTYPGHWAYERMDIAKSTEGITFDALSQVQSKLHEGDEVFCRTGDTSGVAHFTFNQLLWRSGDAVSGLEYAKVIRSGGRNVPNTEIGSIVTLKDPVKNNTLAFEHVLNAGATQFEDGWKRFCNCPDSVVVPSGNPYITGERGKLRPHKSYTYLTNRVQNTPNQNVDIRNDGYFNQFSLFWQPQSTTEFLQPEGSGAGNNWQFKTEITNYNPNGKELENRDALSRYSMAQFGYGRDLPISVSNNSEYSESAFDGFEDYGYRSCKDNHLNWLKFEEYVTQKAAHSGRRSIKVTPENDSLGVRKIINQCGQSNDQ